MEVKKINYWIIIIILSLTSLWVMFLYAKDKDVTQGITAMIEIPYEIEDWRGKDIELDEEIFRILGTDKVILREYRTPENDIIWLYIVYSEKDRTSFHPPEYCYIGSAETELIKREIVTISLKKGKLFSNKLIFQMPKGQQMVLFWYMVDNHSFASYYRQQLHLIFNIIKGKSSQGMMVRLSSYFSQSNEEKKFSNLTNFIRDLEPYLID